MKTSFSSLILSLALALPALAIDVVTNDIPIDSTLVTLSNTTVTATGTAVQIPFNTDLTFIGSYTTTNNGFSSNHVASLNLSADNSLWTTAYPIVLTHQVNGSNTTGVVATILNRTNFSGFKWIRLDKAATTQTNSVTFNRLQMSYWK